MVESLERINETKNEEIGDLRKVLDDTGISQFDGIDDDVISVTTVENDSDADSEESSETLNYCKLCDFKTHLRHLQQHISVAYADHVTLPLT